LRGFAAFSVLLSHWRDALYVDYSAIGHHNPLISVVYLLTGLGHQWVIVFFVMSGYLVGGSVVRSVSKGTWSWRGYLLTRLTRLYIVLLPALLLGGAADWAGMHVPGTEAIYSGRAGMHELTFDLHTTLTPQTLAANGLFLQTIALPGMGGHHIPTFGSNGPLWSLSNEFWYYMAFPLLVLLLAINKPRRLRVACGLGLAAWGWFVGAPIALLGVTWIMGVAITYLPALSARSPWRRALAIAAAMALFAIGMVIAKLHSSLGTELLLGALVTLLIWVTLHCATAPLPSIYVWLAQRSARSSYTLYLIHVPILLFLKASLHLPRAFPDGQGLLVRVALLAAIVLYAQLVYALFEKNTDYVRNWIKPYVMRWNWKQLRKRSRGGKGGAPRPHFLLDG
jgi:peptidoglycan/LPS O-acetylase OafA/YrhL